MKPQLSRSAISLGLLAPFRSSQQAEQKRALVFIGDVVTCSVAFGHERLLFTFFLLLWLQEAAGDESGASDESTDSFVTVDELQKLGVNVADIAKLKSAGLNTVSWVVCSKCR